MLVLVMTTTEDIWGESMNKKVQFDVNSIDCYRDSCMDSKCELGIGHPSCYFDRISESLLVERGDNLQLFISPLLKYEEWLYNIIDDKKFLKSIHWNPPVHWV